MITSEKMGKWSQKKKYKILIPTENIKAHLEFINIWQNNKILIWKYNWKN